MSQWEADLRRLAELAATPLPPRPGGPAPPALPDTTAEPAGGGPAVVGYGGRDDRGHRIGLVLAGGAAKGAYQVGVIEYLAEIGTTLAAVAGTSIGGLNGAVLAAAPSLAAGSAQVRSLWDGVARVSAGHAPVPVPADGELTDSWLETLRRTIPGIRNPIFAPRFLPDLVREHIDPAALRAGLPLYVAAFPAVQPDLVPLRLGWATDLVRSGLGARSEMIHINGLPTDEDMRQAILASAAIPVIIAPKPVGRSLYRDGFLGGVNGNTPLGALANQAGCDYVIVVHLGQGVLLDPGPTRHLTVLEISPSVPLSPPGAKGQVEGLLDFSPDRVGRLRRLGYADAKRCLERVRAQLGVVRRRRAAQAEMAEAVDRLDGLRFPARDD